MRRPAIQSRPVRYDTAVDHLVDTLFCGEEQVQVQQLREWTAKGFFHAEVRLLAFVYDRQPEEVVRSLEQRLARRLLRRA